MWTQVRIFYNNDPDQYLLFLASTVNIEVRFTLGETGPKSPETINFYGNNIITSGRNCAKGTKKIRRLCVSWKNQTKYISILFFCCQAGISQATFIWENSNHNAAQASKMVQTATVGFTAILAFTVAAVLSETIPQGK